MSVNTWKSLIPLEWDSNREISRAHKFTQHVLSAYYVLRIWRPVEASWADRKNQSLESLQLQNCCLNGNRFQTPKPLKYLLTGFFFNVFLPKNRYLKNCPRCLHIQCALVLALSEITGIVCIYIPIYILQGANNKPEYSQET